MTITLKGGRKSSNIGINLDRPNQGLGIDNIVRDRDSDTKEEDTRLKRVGKRVEVDRIP